MGASKSLGWLKTFSGSMSASAAFISMTAAGCGTLVFVRSLAKSWMEGQLQPLHHTLDTMLAGGDTKLAGGDTKLAGVGGELAGVRNDVNKLRDDFNRREDRMEAHFLQLHEDMKQILSALVVLEGKQQ